VYNRDVNTLQKIPGHVGQEYNHISDPLLKNDEYTNYGHTERILMTTVLRDLLALQE
jgi:hypothetical protein